MRRIVIAVLLALSTIQVSAKVYKPSDISPVHLQDRNRYVCNPDGILSQAAVDSIDAAFRIIEDSTGIQTLVAVLSGIDPDDCFEFAHQLGEKVGVGRSGSDNGLVILLCTGERCIQFATGYGIEGLLPDALCKRIQVRYMNDYFANDEWDKGMVAGADALKDILLKGEYDDSDDASDKAAAIAAISVIVGFFLLTVLLAVYFERKSRKCPKCGQITLKQVGVSTISRHNGVKKELLTFKCTHCGYIMSRNRTSYYSTGGGGHHLGGGLGGGFNGGGGHIGGSYGGGHFGGGGAGSRF
ncbi:MAG: TPM domain-containing protein [Bacteroidaceae bacterium]|nr:TPM domain-containing protein [Bacteroidaceae bacterium]